MDLSVETREKFGKVVKSLRREGFIPAELYGRGLKNLHLSVAAKDFLKVFKEAGSTTLVNLLLNGDKHTALIHDIDKDYLTGEISHIDFYQVRLDEKIKAKVPLEFIGEAPAVKEKGGILNKVMTDIEVEAFPSLLPRRLVVNLGLLHDLNKSIYVKDIEIPHGAKVYIDPETAVVTVTQPIAEEKKIEAPVGVGEVKVETEEKKAEREAEKVKKEEISPPMTETKGGSSHKE